MHPASQLPIGTGHFCVVLFPQILLLWYDVAQGREGTSGSPWVQSTTTRSLVCVPRIFNNVDVLSTSFPRDMYVAQIAERDRVLCYNACAIARADLVNPVLGCV